MNNKKLKKEIHTLIDNTEDEKLLNMVMEDIIAIQKESKKEYDDLSDLTPEERTELEEQANEDFEKDTITEEEFNQHIQKWRDKLSSKNDF